MKLFDRISEDEDEVVIKEREDDWDQGKKEARLEQEVEEKVAGSSGSSTAGPSSTGSGSSSSTGVDLPGMDSSSSSGSRSTRSTGSKVDIQDVHDQNEKIISLLEDIKDEVGDSSTGGDTTELL